MLSRKACSSGLTEAFRRRHTRAAAEAASCAARRRAPGVRRRAEGRGGEPRHLPHRRRHDRLQRPQPHAHIRARSRAAGLGRMAPGVRQARRPAHQGRSRSAAWPSTGWASRSCARPQANEPAQIMNDIVRERAYLNGIKYIDITAHFADEAGNYTPYGPDIAGKQRLVREVDGVLFTGRRFPQARAFRRARDQARPDAGPERPCHSAGRRRGGAEAHRGAAPAPGPGHELEEHGAGHQGGQGRQGRAAQVCAAIAPVQPPPAADLPRRAESRQRPHLAQDHCRRGTRGNRDARAAPPAHSRRRDPAHDAQGHRRPPLADGRRAGRRCRAAGWSCSAPSRPLPTGGARRASPGQPYYQVWIKGERLPPRPGRADDFSWPRTDPDLMGNSDRSRRRPLAKTLPRS